MRRSLFDKKSSDVQSLLSEVGRAFAAAIEDPKSFDRFKRERLSAERMPTLPLQPQDVKRDEAFWRDSLVRLSSRRAASEIESKERINGAALELGKPAVDMLRILAESGSVRFEELATRSGIDEERLRYMLSDLRTYDVISVETDQAPAIARVLRLPQDQALSTAGGRLDDEMGEMEAVAVGDGREFRFTTGIFVDAGDESKHELRGCCTRSIHRHAHCR